MAVLTEDRQFVLGLGMLAADMRSGLCREERIAAVYWMQRETCPAAWRLRVQAYVDKRRCVARKALLHRQGTMLMALELARKTETRPEEKE